MGLSTGIIGLPNVGKSTLFNTLTNLDVLIANYPFATIDANVGIVNVKDNRLDNLSRIVNSEQIIYAYAKFIDIAGLVKGASKGEGLGNKFLENIRSVDAICHVIRCFQEKEVVSVNEEIDPIFDIEIINLELICSDIESIEKRLLKIKNKVNSGEKNFLEEFELLNKALEGLKNNKLLNELIFSDDERKLLNQYSLLTIKPMLYVANISEKFINNPLECENYKKLVGYLKDKIVIPMCIKFENELSKIPEEQKEEFLNDFGFSESSIDILIKKCFKLLDLSTYFTIGKKEARAWIFKNGWLAPKCAGVIHSDFEKKFIKAEILKYEDILELGSESKCRETGKIKIVGKDYLMQDGDICNFKINR